MSRAVDLTIAIVNWNTGRFLGCCLDSISGQPSDLACEMVVVDNASSDGSTAAISAFPKVRLILNQENLGFARASNQALQEAHGRYFLLLNPDTEVRPGALEAMVTFMDEHPDAGALGCQLLNPNGTIQVSCGHFPNLANMALESLGLSRLYPKSKRVARFKMTYWSHDEEREVDQPSGACLMIRRAAWEQVGPLDERFFMYFEEVDLCYRLKKAGWRIFFTPRAQVVHYGGGSSRQHIDVRVVVLYQSLIRFFQKHYGGWQVLALKGLILGEMTGRSLITLSRAIVSRSSRRTLMAYLARYAQVALLCLKGAG